MNKNNKLIYLMVAGALLLVGGYILIWTLNSRATSSGTQSTIVERRVDRDIELTDADGVTRHFAELSGKVWLVAHVFTRCPGQCAGISVVLDDLRSEFDDDGLHFVSVTLDPEHDGPTELKDFATKHELLGDDWWFVTGEPGPLNAYMKEVFLLAAQENPEADRSSEGDLFLHEPRIVLVGHDLTLRGWFYPFDGKSMSALKKEIKAALTDAKRAKN